MVEIKPFKALMYNQKIIKDLNRVICPPYDVISEDSQTMLYHNDPHNIVRLEFGRDYLDDDEFNNKYIRARMYLREWLNDHIFIFDENPSLYLYEQEFVHWDRVYRLIGFISLVRLEYFEKGVIKPHEQTFSQPKKDRLSLMNATKSNFSPVWGLYYRSNKIYSIMQRKREEKPFIDIRDNDEVKHRLWKVEGKDDINIIKEEMKNKDVFIADGHHRYETALNYRDIMRDRSVSIAGDEPYNYIMMFLVDIENSGLIILPTHRLVRNIKNFAVGNFTNKLGEFFEIEDIKKNEIKEAKRIALEKISEGSKITNSFAVYVGDGHFLILKLKTGTSEEFMDKDKSKDWNSLDVIVLHKIIIEHILGKEEEALSSGEDVTYMKTEDRAISMVDEGKYQLAIFLPPPRASQVIKIANNKEKMPHKTTYFYPKPPTGLVFHSFYENNNKGG